MSVGRWRGALGEEVAWYYVIMPPLPHMCDDILPRSHERMSSDSP